MHGLTRPSVYSALDHFSVGHVHSSLETCLLDGVAFGDAADTHCDPDFWNSLGLCELCDSCVSSSLASVFLSVK